MGSLLQFPPRILPWNVHAPPYVKFGINGKDISHVLPDRIPLKIVLCFVPKFKEWLHPTPPLSELPISSAEAALHKPYVGIDILASEVSLLGLKTIICTILQVTGVSVPASHILVTPTIKAATGIYKAWIILDLPSNGADNLLIHIYTLLSLGPPVKLSEMQILWISFPHESRIIEAMALNFLRTFINNGYTPYMMETIKEWYQSDQECNKFFSSLEARYTAFVDLEFKKLKVPETPASPPVLPPILPEDPTSMVYKMKRRSSKSKGPKDFVAQLVAKLECLNLDKKPANS